MISGNKIILREKRLADARSDYHWEIDPELARLDATPAPSISFSRYLFEYGNDLNNPHPTSRRFAIDTLEGEHIGNCSYYSISETKGQAELGIMIGNRDYWDNGYGTDVVNTLVNHIFDSTNLGRIYLKTLESNIRAKKCFRKCGFTCYGHMARNGYKFSLMEIHRERWQQGQNGDLSQACT